MDKRVTIKLTTGNEIVIDKEKVISTIRFARYGLEYNQDKHHYIIPYQTIEFMDREMK